MNIDEIIQDRESSNGNFDDLATVAQTLKAVMRRGKNWDSLHNPSKEALEMIATKVARILNGDANNPDHWNDIAGYARLRGNALAAPKLLGELETGISQLAKRFRPVVTRINDEGGSV